MRKVIEGVLVLVRPSLAGDRDRGIEMFVWNSEV